ncbi:MAG TPA: primosomal protein N' [Vicinamibacteria bacterium]
MGSRALDVALPLPVQSPFTYAMPEGLARPPRGARVLVPFGSRRIIGVVTGEGRPQPASSLKDMLEVVDETPLVPPPLLDLAAWMAEHYLAPPGECYRLVLPPGGVRASRAVAKLVDAGTPAGDALVDALREGPLQVSTLARRLGRDPSAALARLRRAGLVSIEQQLGPGAPSARRVRVAVLRDASLASGRAQADLVARLAAAGGRLRVADLAGERASSRGVLARLARRGAVTIEDEAEEAGTEATAPFTLTAEQQRALEPVAAGIDQGGYHVFLLHGVTGSGKTEVYLRAAERALALGRGVLILVPEIALTPRLVRAALARFGARISVLHSELPLGARHDHWWRIREGIARVVVGARSAVFAPVADLGLIVVDEEHEGTYKQDESPRYHARDVAIVRAKLEGATVLLGSATPSVESYANAQKGKYALLTMPRRIGPRGLPRVKVVDRRRELQAGGDAILSAALREALAERLARGEQSLLLLNRRGYATSLLCRECGLQALCPNCSVSLVLHQGGRRADCHYCGHSAAAPARCAACSGEYLRMNGFGTEKVVESVKAALPTARVDRLDADRAARRGAAERVLTAFGAGELDVLVGTQLIAKGHDFPRVTLAGVIDADVGLGLPDFRSAERTFQLLTQLAGRAGRADLAGEVILQTHLPGHYALRLACAQDYESFFAQEMEFRRTMAYPPAAALLNLIVRSRDHDEAAAAAEALARTLRETAGGRYRVLGPAQAPLARLRQEHRYQVLLKGGRRAMREAARGALVARYGELRWPGVAVDVDPVTLM